MIAFSLNKSSRVASGFTPLALEGFSMYSIVEVQGHQYRIAPGDCVDVQKVPHEVGETLELENVLFIGGDEPQLGLPFVPGAKIKAQVIRQDRGAKIIVYRRAVGKWRRKKGHRQSYSALLITEIVDGKGVSHKIDSESKLAQKFLK